MAGRSGVEDGRSVPGTQWLTRRAVLFHVAHLPDHEVGSAALSRDLLRRPHTFGPDLSLPKTAFWPREEEKEKEQEQEQEQESAGSPSAGPP